MLLTANLDLQAGDEIRILRLCKRVVESKYYHRTLRPMAMGLIAGQGLSQDEKTTCPTEILKLSQRAALVRKFSL